MLGPWHCLVRALQSPVSCQSTTGQRLELASAAQHRQHMVSRAAALAVLREAVALISVLWEAPLPVFTQLFSLLVLSSFCSQYFTAVKMQTKS